MTQVRKSPSVALWEALDEYLASDRYMRFALDSHRDWDDCRRRAWQAVIFMESGKIVARATSDTRDGAMREVLKKAGKDVPL